MRLATWNVNSIRAREERLRAFLAEQAPDVVCLQELKVEDAKFPTWLADDGWHVAKLCQRTYNGVAILARKPLHDVALGLPGDDQARLVTATVDGVRLCSAYFPNGQALGTDKYDYKLRWMDKLRTSLAITPQFALCGDFNVAPEPRDVHDPARWEASVLYSPEVRASLEKLRVAHGLVDTYRLHHDEAGKYSWWDYRLLAFPRDHGLRIDHVFATPALAKRCTAAEILREERKGKGASDHAPVLVTFA